MRVGAMFYTVGGLFAVASIAYFASIYVVYASASMKLAMLATLSVALFFNARYLEAGDI